MRVLDATYPSGNCISTTYYPLPDVLSTCIEGLLIYSVASGFKILLYYSYTSILSECWPWCNSDSHAIFHKDSPNQTGPPKLVGSSHQHQPGRASLAPPPRLDPSDYSEPWRWPSRMASPISLTSLTLPAINSMVPKIPAEK